MGADVRPCNVNDIFVDSKTRVISTPAYMYEEARLTEVAQGIEKLVRALLQLARDRRPAPRPEGQVGGPQQGRPQQGRPQPGPRQPAGRPPESPSRPGRAPERRKVTPARGSV
jgi:hypothetical protein